MHLLTIIWTLICAAVIIGYPLYLLNKSVSLLKDHQKNSIAKEPNTVELLSFDITEQLPSWSFSLDVPQITEQILRKNPVLFYLEAEDTCLKLPLNNAAMGYKANVYKNVGKVYVTFKSLKDGVSHFYVPNWHLKKLKVLIIRSKDERIHGNPGVSPSKSIIHENLTNAGININDYEDVLGYLSNIASIDFKGHFIAKIPKRKKVHGVSTKPLKSINKEQLYATT
ncbi:hypothetical protein PY092_15645 [Muricauda sp. 334s03]|uniref:Uncharacterized protein n=1 Tax=Flagellimonas yonaguniensis TaxID=3031325 RepID=A0ABT5Y3I3_9FLAO|nr:hypothetical protein [[Muricauda] yonaguniensis]MDF0717597.1 hypothetical protein [[Muricauda] yonaguniensis]